MGVSREEAFEAFQRKLIDAVASYYGDGCEVDVKIIQKLNGIQLHGLNILRKGSIVCPTIYLEDYFSRYERGTAFSTVFRDIIGVYETHKNTEFGALEFFADYEKIKKHLSVKIINADYNRELLEDVPNIKINDLAVVCIVEVVNSEVDLGTVLIRNNHICMWGVKNSQLIEDAIENAQRINIPHLRKLSDIVLNMYCEDIPGENLMDERHNGCMLTDELEVCSREPNNMFVLSNKKQMFGAGTMIYPGVLDSIGKALGTDYYILPSSIHEVIILPVNVCENTYNINSMIRSINEEMLSKEEILSDHAYLYNISNSCLTAVSDTSVCSEEAL